MIAHLESHHRRVKLAATFVHHGRTSVIEYGFPVAPAGAKRRILMRWHYPDGRVSELGQDAYTGAITFATFDAWMDRLAAKDRP